MILRIWQAHQITNLRVEVEAAAKTAKKDASQDPQEVEVKLPKLDIKPYTGILTEWQSFWDSFESAVHDRARLNPVDKFNHPKAKLKGESSDCISDNYKHAIDLLKGRYGSDEKRISTHQDALQLIPTSTFELPSAKQTYD